MASCAADGTVDNDATLELYARVALAQAEAGAAVVAPSGMMDGQVGAIRSALDGAGFDETIIMAYAAKYASGLYGPFRDAVGVEIVGGGDRKGYQQDYRNRREALREARADVEAGRRHRHGEARHDVPRHRERPAPRARRAARARIT